MKRDHDGHKLQFFMLCTANIMVQGITAQALFFSSLLDFSTQDYINAF